MGMGIKHGIGNGKPPQWEWELPAPHGKFYNAKGTMCLNMKYEAEPDRERF